MSNSIYSTQRIVRVVAGVCDQRPYPMGNSFKSIYRGSDICYSTKSIRSHCPGDWRPTLEESLASLLDIARGMGWTDDGQ